MGKSLGKITGKILGENPRGKYLGKIENPRGKSWGTSPWKILGENPWEKSPGKIPGENPLGKSPGKILGENPQGKSRVNPCGKSPEKIPRENPRGNWESQRKTGIPWENSQIIYPGILPWYSRGFSPGKPSFSGYLIMYLI